MISKSSKAFCQLYFTIRLKCLVLFDFGTELIVRKGFGLNVLWPEQSFGEFSPNSYGNGTKKFTGRVLPAFLELVRFPGNDPRFVWFVCAYR